MTLLFDHHVLLNCNTVIDYVFEKTDYFTHKENLDAKELSDGNINYVFKVWDTVSGKSLVVKQADKFLRSSGRPLDVKRNKIEAEILQIEVHNLFSLVIIFYRDVHKFPTAIIPD